MPKTIELDCGARPPVTVQVTGDDGTVTTRTEEHPHNINGVVELMHDHRDYRAVYRRAHERRAPQPEGGDEVDLRRHAEKQTALGNVPDTLPGVRVSIDPLKRTVKIEDPLHGHPDTPKVEEAFRLAFGQHLQAHAPITLQNLDDNELNDWENWIDRLIAVGQAVEVQPPAEKRSTAPKPAPKVETPAQAS